MEQEQPVSSPSGTYKLRIELLDVTEETKLLVQANGATQVCNLKRLPGYQNAQPCEVTLTTNGASILATIRSSAPYAFLGPVRFRSASGDRPIGITWELETPMPAALFDRFATLAQT